MKVPKEPKVFEQLRTEVLESCPEDCSPTFKAGHEYYSNMFFEELTIHSNIFYDLNEGTCTIDLDFLKVDARQLSLQRSVEQFSENRTEFLEGVDFAESVTLETILFALAMKPSSQIA